MPWVCPLGGCFEAQVSLALSSQELSLTMVRQVNQRIYFPGWQVTSNYLGGGFLFLGEQGEGMIIPSSMQSQTYRGRGGGRESNPLGVGWGQLQTSVLASDTYLFSLCISQNSFTFHTSLHSPGL